MNRNTARSFFFDPLQYGGLGLPALYTSAGIGQLHLLLSRLHLQDKIVKLILMAISYIQLLVGCSTLFINTAYDKYYPLADDSWLTSIWCFLSKIKMQLQIRQAFNPSPSRKNDQSLTDFFVSLGYKPAELKWLNKCQQMSSPPTSHPTL